jgi:hypothetical protein
LSDLHYLSVAEPNALVAALLGAALPASPCDLLLFATIDPDRMYRSFGASFAALGGF